MNIAEMTLTAITEMERAIIWADVSLLFILRLTDVLFIGASAESVVLYVWFRTGDIELQDCSSHCCQPCSRCVDMDTPKWTSA